MKWTEGRVLRKLNWKLPAKKNEYNYGNNISRIYSDTLRKIHMNQSQELLANNKTSYKDSLHLKNSTQY